MSSAGHAVAITGIGFTPYSRSSKSSLLGLAVDACQAAIADAGLTPSDVDGLICYHTNDSALTRDVSPYLGIPELRWWTDTSAGGGYNCASIAQAAAVVQAGLANAVICYRAMLGRSGKRIGRYRASMADGVHQYMTPYGFSTAAQMFGMTCRRHMYQYGTTREQLGKVAVTVRSHAVLNERAIRREPLTMDEYLNGRIIADPYTLYDCCQESDGGCAVLVTRADRAADAPHPPVYLLGSVQGGGLVTRVPFDGWPDFAESAFPRMARELYAKVGIGPSDVDLACFYDAFTFEIIEQLEDFGVCGKGEGGPYVENVGIGLDSRMPVNPHGGLLSEAYIHGLNHVIEAVQQLRGGAGQRQVQGANVALVTGFGFNGGSAMVLGGKNAG
jgi:acetyl-CoA acetyltransferase